MPVNVIIKENKFLPRCLNVHSSNKYVNYYHNYHINDVFIDPLNKFFYSEFPIRILHNTRRDNTGSCSGSHKNLHTYN